MRYYGVYRRVIGLLPRKMGEKEPVLRCLQKYRAYGGAVCLFDEKGVAAHWSLGFARENVPVTEQTYFRTASVAKMVTAMMALRLSEQGKLDLDGDAGRHLNMAFRHPRHPDTPITVRMLLSHTSSILDSDAFWQGAKTGARLEAVLGCAAFGDWKPGEKFAYSNFGAGILGAVLEGASGKCLDALFREMFPGITASFYPQNLPKDACLADGRSILPPKKCYDGKALHDRVPAAEQCAPAVHYALAHGNLCIRARDLAEIARQAMTGFEALRVPQIAFGPRDPHITEGLGMFIIRDETLSPRVIYGHQGLAYGVVNGAFFDPETGRGFVLLTSGVSLARKYVLADVNRELCHLLLGGNV